VRGAVVDEDDIPRCRRRAGQGQQNDQKWGPDSSRPRGPLLAAGDRLLDHGLVDGDDVRAGISGIEFETADHASEGLAQRARAEALLARGVPGDGDQRAPRDLQVDAEPLEVGARGAEDRRFRLDEDTRQVGFGEDR